MHPRVIAQRTSAAQERRVAAALTLAEQRGLKADLVAALSVYERDPETRKVMQDEAVADFLEAIVAADKKAEKREADPAPGAGLERMSVPDLKDLAAQRGVELEARMKKADIIVALEAGNPAPPPEPEQQP